MEKEIASAYNHIKDVITYLRHFQHFDIYIFSVQHFTKDTSFWILIWSGFLGLSANK